MAMHIGAQSFKNGSCGLGFTFKKLEHNFFLLIYSSYFGSQQAQTLINVLIAAVYLFNIIYPALAVGRESCYEQRHAGSYVGRRHAHPAQPMLLIKAYHRGSVWVTKNNLCAHVYQLVDEEKAAFKHLLVKEYGAFGLSGYHYEHAKQIGSQTGPRCVVDGHEGTVKKCLYLIVVLLRHTDKIFTELQANAQPLETFGYVAQFLDIDIAYG
jgi:hypothetical protein